MSKIDVYKKDVDRLWFLDFKLEHQTPLKFTN